MSESPEADLQAAEEFIQRIHDYFNSHAASEHGAATFSSVKPYSSDTYISVIAANNNASIQLFCEGRNRELRGGNKNSIRLPEDFGNACAVIEQYVQAKFKKLETANLPATGDALEFSSKLAC